MGKIIVEIISSAKIKRELHILDKDSIAIGRGYDNDVILSDSYVDSVHVRISCGENQSLIVEDLNSRNGVSTLKNENHLKLAKRISESTQIDSGDLILIGNTLIRVFHSSHKILPVKPISKEKSFLYYFGRSSTHWIIGLIGVILINYINGWLYYPFTDNPTNQIIFGELLGLVGIVVWAGIWALIGRFIRHRYRFRVHFAISCFFVILLIPIINISGFLGFIFMNRALEIWSFVILLGSLTALLLFLHKTYATHLKFQTRMILAISIPVSLIAISLMGTIAFQGQFRSEPPYYARLKPPIVKPLKVYNLDDYFVNMDKTFKKAKDKLDEMDSTEPDENLEDQNSFFLDPEPKID